MINSPRTQGQKNVLVVSSTFPSSIQPIHGVFVKERLAAVARRGSYKLHVVSATPYFPPIKSFRRWYLFSQLPAEENIETLEVRRPRYVLPPKIGGHFHSRLMAGAVRRMAASWLGREKIDLIDAHFIYPDGAAAAGLARQWGLPLVITCRGEDILSMPDLPLCVGPIRDALSQATQLVALSEEIAERMLQLGAKESKITVIPNGVDTKKFQPMCQRTAREQCALPLDRYIVVSVGYRLERKGFHLLIEAAARLKKTRPDLMVVIVGGQARWGQDYTTQIQATIKRFGMSDHVLLAGPKHQNELAAWYSAADLFALISSREGSPNVLMEALACGPPALATAVGGIPEILAADGLGVLLPERNVDAVAEGLRTAIATSWDRGNIRQEMLRHDWTITAETVESVYDRALLPAA